MILNQALLKIYTIYELQNLKIHSIPFFQFLTAFKYRIEWDGAAYNSTILQKKLQTWNNRGISSLGFLRKINIPIFCTGIEENLLTSFTKFFSILGTEFNNPSTRASRPAILSREIDLP